MSAGISLGPKKGRPRHYLTTPEGRTVTEDHFGPPLAAFIRGDLELKPLKPPANLGPLLYSLDAETLAVIGLMPLLDGWARGWDWENQSHTTVCLEVGRHLEARSGKELTDKERVLAGQWLVECATGNNGIGLIQCDNAVRHAFEHALVVVLNLLHV